MAQGEEREGRTAGPPVARPSENRVVPPVEVTGRPKVSPPSTRCATITRPPGL